MENSRVVMVEEASNPPVTSAWGNFAALIKIGIVNSNAITTFTGLWLAFMLTGKHFLQSLDIVIFTMIGSSFIIAGACALNNFIDRDIDPIMERTKGRPTVTGKISGTKVLAIGLTFVIIGLLMLFKMNITTGIIGIIGVFTYVVLYSMWSKRLYVSNTIIGSISGAVPPLIGWAAVDPTLPPMAWMLFLIMFIWQPPHFYALAMRRVEEYRAAGIPMLPVVKGFAVTKLHIVVWIAFLLPIPFFMTSLGIPFVILATILNIGWLVVGIMGYKKKDDIKWATQMFVYSLNYLTILFTAMVILSVI
ncbi:heme o synthase [Lederbergia lenta]|uniref:Protoheme IX farnesyltransferase n=1 Tax=Lederbergia lenta TaxID=1467 RepID=A0A2X4WBK5_LEDLE|nr:heme o synthase [Lederbergia lenta]MCM3110277.1 heme o synthase [Lederbergia lenta]MEC2324154.1 heme o synthase [Lederbergia lenta]SQI60541.1 protoheme IX farnesyltransferase [Lederbergia lenta]